MKELAPLHVVVRFGPGISGDVQARSLLEFERILRRISKELDPSGEGQWLECFKEIKGDDSRLRTMMTKDERAKL